MRALLAIVLTLTCAESSAHELSANERKPFVLVVLTPNGAMATTSRSELYTIAAETLIAETGLSLSVYDDSAAIDRCRGYVSCIARECCADRRAQHLAVIS